MQPIQSQNPIKTQQKQRANHVIPNTHDRTLSWHRKKAKKKTQGLNQFPPVFSWVYVTRNLVLCVCFVDRCLSFCTFSFGHCVVCSSSIYGFDYPFGIFSSSSLCAETFSFSERCIPYVSKMANLTNHPVIKI